MIIKKSSREELLDERLREQLTGKPRELIELLINDDEIGALQHYANIVSIKRLQHNDHGPVHMRQASINAIKIFNLLQEAGVTLSLAAEEAGDHEDSLCAILLGSFLHDGGMSLTRALHEQTALILAKPIIDRLLQQVYGESNQRFVVRSLALEAILGHMGITPVFSLEAGILLVADGCDMHKGRARIPLALIRGDEHLGKRGDMHKYSAEAIDRVSIEKGSKKPIKIEVKMSSPIGFFQIEEVLLPKIGKSAIKNYIELVGTLNEGTDYKHYL